MENKVKTLKENSYMVTIECERNLCEILHQIVIELCDENKEILFDKHINISCDDLCPTWLDIKRIYIDKNNQVIIVDDNNGEWNYHSLTPNELNAIIQKL